MLSSEFDQIFNEHINIKKHYGGCFGRDKIPRTLKKFQFIICNTDLSSSDGQHWFTFYRHSKDEVLLNKYLAYLALNYRWSQISKVKFVC